MGEGFQFNIRRRAFNRGDLEEFSTFKLLLNFDSKIAHIIKGKIRLEVYHACNIG